MSEEINNLPAILSEMPLKIVQSRDDYLFILRLIKYLNSRVYQFKMVLRVDAKGTRQMETKSRRDERTSSQWTQIAKQNRTRRRARTPRPR